MMADRSHPARYDIDLVVLKLAVTGIGYGLWCRMIFKQ